MKSSTAVALIVAFCGQVMSISAIAQPVTPPLSDLDANTQQMLAKMSPDQKNKLAESALSTLSRVDPDECSAENVLIAIYCKSTAKSFAEYDAQDLVALVGDTEKAKFKASTDAIIKHRVADIQISEDRLKKISDDDLKREVYLQTEFERL